MYEEVVKYEVREWISLYAGLRNLNFFLELMRRHWRIQNMEWHVQVCPLDQSLWRMVWKRGKTRGRETQSELSQQTRWEMLMGTSKVVTVKRWQIGEILRKKLDKTLNYDTESKTAQKWKNIKNMHSKNTTNSPNLPFLCVPIIFWNHLTYWVWIK